MKANPKRTRKKLSIVSTLFYSASYIAEFCYRSSEVATSLVGDDFEIILVNDGSPDNSLEVAIEISKNDPHICVVDFSRNFGHHKAMMTGLAHSYGELVFLIDIDLEEKPEWLLLFMQEMQEKECDVVYGQQASRRGGLIERCCGELYYFLFKRLTNLDVAKNQATARLMTRRYVDSLLMHRERELVMLGLWHITGYIQIPIPILKENTSQTTYTLRRKVAMLVNSITSFSATPLILIFYLGLLIFSIAGFCLMYILLNWLFFSKPLMGWTSLMVSIWLLGGAIILFIGIVGIYLSKVYIETKQRPYTIIRKIYKHTAKHE